MSNSAASPQLPAIPTEMVQTPAALDALCGRLRAAGTFAFDTEFIGENTYIPILCLVQVATAERVDLVDPFALNPEALAPLWALLGDPALEKICHAGAQDVEIAWQQSGRVPQNVFDTQIGAGMVGIAYPTALWRAVEFYTGVTLDKAHTYSAWDRRPLSKAQFQYAVDDVRYLPAIHAAMTAKLQSLGHLDWMHHACNEMCADNAAPANARMLYARIRGAGSLSGSQLAVLREVAALREQLAYEHDRPPRTLFKDETLIDMALRQPNTPRAFGAVRDIRAADVEPFAAAFIDAVARGRAVPEDQQPRMPSSGEDSAEVKRLSETLWIAAQTICLGQSVTPAVVTSQTEVASFARAIHRGKSLDDHPLMIGWHRECLGEKLAAFSRGQLSVTACFADNEMRAAFSTPKPS